MALSAASLPPHLPAHQAPNEAAFEAPNSPQPPLSWSDWLGHKVVEAVEYKTRSMLGVVPTGPVTEPKVAAAGRWLAAAASSRPAGPPPAWP